MGYTKTKSILSAANSNLTSPAYYIGDAIYATLSVQSSNASAPSVQVQITDAGGFGTGVEAVNLNANSSSTLWSTLTTLITPGVFSLSPSVGAVGTSASGLGFGWVRAIRSSIGVSAASNITVNLNWLVVT